MNNQLGTRQTDAERYLATKGVIWEPPFGYIKDPTEDGATVCTVDEVGSLITTFKRNREKAFDSIVKYYPSFEVDLDQNQQMLIAEIADAYADSFIRSKF